MTFNAPLNKYRKSPFSERDKRERFEKIAPVALPSFQSRAHSVHTTLKTPRKKMSANPRASILYRKIYNIRRPIFASIILLLPAHAQVNIRGFIQKGKTQSEEELIREIKQIRSLMNNK